MSCHFRDGIERKRDAHYKADLLELIERNEYVLPSMARPMEVTAFFGFFISYSLSIYLLYSLDSLVTSPLTYCFLYHQN